MRIGCAALELARKDQVGVMGRGRPVKGMKMGRGDEVRFLYGGSA